MGSGRVGYLLKSRPPGRGLTAVHGLYIISIPHYTHLLTIIVSNIYSHRTNIIDLVTNTNSKYQDQRKQIFIGPANLGFSLYCPAVAAPPALNNDFYWSNIYCTHMSIDCDVL